ncbi:2-oxoglutarate ferredoxin oxidoreductase subunit beta [Deltaproteobacteria bacterium]|nr:2-oxoglutarate ferredoxin oxidoreductase subunit beta [Deltaproteobacteria bacterium]
MDAQPRTYAKKDFMSDQIIRWCPGCGDYAILSQAQTVFAELGIPRENFAIVSGIGCSSRFPYYINAYGFHTIHGRAFAVATGLKVTRPELSVWVATGDGDALSIGGNHFIHVLRRNVDLQILLFNNRIYGLTKGQFSPTSEVGKKTKSSPMGSVDHPFTPSALALGADASFVARTVDIFTKDQRDVFRAASDHKGTSFVEILQNCNIFNDGAWDQLTDKTIREERCLFLQHGQPMVFAGGKKGIKLNGLRPAVVELGNGLGPDDCLVHDETDPFLGAIVARLDYPEFPVPMGVLFRKERPTYDTLVNDQVAEAKAGGAPSLQKLLNGGETWTVK